MITRSEPAPKRVWLDGAVIGGLLLAINALFGRGDPGWLEVNPSPWLLLPMMMGARYGFTAGLVAALTATVAIAAARAGMGFSASIGGAVRSDLYFYTGLLAAGGLAGELWIYFRRRILQLHAHEESLRSKVRKLDSDALVLREAKDELDRITAARDGEISSLDAELRRLYTSPVEALPDAILSLIKRQARVTDAALYRVDSSTPDLLQRFGLMGEDTLLPETIAPGDHDLVQRALELKTMVTLPEILIDENVDEETLLMAAPLIGADGEPRALLVVAGMPFIAFNPASAEIIDLVCEWSGGVLELSEGAEGRYRIVGGREAQKIFLPDHFEHLVAMAFQSCQRHRLPSAIVELALWGQERSQQDKFEQTVLGAVRSGDFASEPQKDYPAVWVLLPLAGERGTDIFLDRCTQFCLRQGIDLEHLKTRRVDLSKVDSVDEAFIQLGGERTQANVVDR